MLCHRAEVAKVFRCCTTDWLCLLQCDWWIASYPGPTQLSWKYQQWWSPISRTSPDPLLVGVVWKRDKTYVLHFKLIQKDYLSLWLNTLFVVAKVCLVVGVNWLTFLYVTLWLRLCVCGLSFGLAICSEWPMGEHSTCACMATKNTAKQMCCFACSHCVIT